MTENVVADSRESLLRPVIEKLKAQSSIMHPVQIAEIRGEVKYPGVYPVTRGMTQFDLVLAAGGLQEQHSPPNYPESINPLKVIFLSLISD